MVTSKPPSEEIDLVYRRLLVGEPDAPADLIELLLVPLITIFSRKYQNSPDPDEISDVVTDSLLRFVQEPHRFRPEKRSLWGYLKMDIDGDLRNRFRSLARTQFREVAIDSVAFSLADGNSSMEETIIERLTPLILPDGTDVASLLTQLREELSEQDWETVMLMIQGERSTSVYAEVFGVADKPLDEQRKLVKHAKDRLRIKLKRRGVGIHER